MKVERMVRKGLVILAAAVLSASSAYAANVETMGIGAMNTSQAGAVSAYCDNVFATYYNPAGLSLIEAPTLTVDAMYYNAKIKVSDWEVKGVNHDNNKNIAHDPNGLNYESDTMGLVSPHLGFAMPVTDKISLGVAAYTPYGLHVTWDKDPSNNPTAAYAWESYYGRVAVSPTLSYKVSDKLAVGVGVSIGRSVSEAGKTVEYYDKFNGISNAYDIAKLNGRETPNQQDVIMGIGLATQESAKFLGTDPGSKDTAAFMAAATLLDDSQLKMEATDDVNYSINLGIMYRPIKQLSFGLTYRGRTETNFEGDVYITGANVLDPKTGLPTTVNLDGTVEMEYDHPEQIQAGVRWFASEKLSMEADVTWTGWSVNDKQVENVVIKNVPTPIPDPDTHAITAIVPMDVPKTFTHERDWEDTTAYRLGVNYQASDAFVFRAGYAYDPSPVPDETFEFGWPDTDRNVYSLGMGWKINERWMLDAVVQHVISTEKRATTGESTELNGNYADAYGDHNAKVYCKDEGILWGGGVSVTYTF